MNQKKIAVNAVLNIIKSGLSIIFPLVTYPYALRILGAENMGKISYSLSLVSYFTLISKFGISSYATREGSKIKDNKEKFSKFVNEIFTLNMILTIITYICLFFAILFIKNFNNYKTLIFIQSIVILTGTIGVEWINNIFEDFLSITLRSIISHIVILLLLFLLVKKSEDYIIYSAISVFASVLVSLFNYVYCKKYINIKICFNLKIFKHLRYLIVFFLGSITVTIYVNLDITMLGLIKGDYSVGMYSTATKIYNILKELIASVYIVAVPRLAFYFGKKDYFEYKILFSNMAGIIILFLLPTCIGMICVAKGIIFLMGGEENLPAVPAMQILAFALFFAILGGLVTACFNISAGYEKNNLIAASVSAFLNFILNLYFIKKIDFNGAAITTCFSEAYVFIYCFIKIKNKKNFIDFIHLAINFIHAIAGCITIIVIEILCSMIIENELIKMPIIIICSIIIYIIELALFKNSNIIKIYSLFKKKLSKKGK